jgi:hypothetical protein
MKKQLFILILLFSLTANRYNNALHEVNNLAFGLQSSAYSNNGILDGSTELSRIGRAIVHMRHRKFWSDPATQNGITALSWIAPIGKGFTFLSNIIRIGAKLITKQAVKEVTNGGFRSVGAAAKGYNKTIQTSGHTLKYSTLKALGLTKEQGNRAIEALKNAHGLKNNDHYKIMANGDIINPHTGEWIDNLFDYIY